MSPQIILHSCECHTKKHGTFDKRGSFPLLWHSLSHLFVWITCLLEIINVTIDILEVSSLVDLIKIELDVTIFSKILT